MNSNNATRLHQRPLGILTLGLLFLVACSENPNESDEPGFASFTVSTIKSSQVQTVSTQISEWDLLVTKVFSFQLCLKDVATLKSIPGQRFKVGDSTSETDPSGCLYWNERISYHRLHSETWVQFARTASGQGDYMGEVALSFAINPWTEELLDLSIHPAPSQMLAESDLHQLLKLSPSQRGENQSLQVEASSLRIDRVETDSEHTIIRALLTAELQTKRQDLESAFQLQSLEAGRFELKLSQGSEEILTVTGLEILDGILQAQVEFSLGALPPPTHSASLELLVTPLDQLELSSASAPFVFTVSELASGKMLRSSRELIPTPPPATSPLGPTAPVVHARPAEAPPLLAPGIAISRNLKAVHSRVHPSSESIEGLSDFAFSLVACLVDSQAFSSVPTGHEFTWSIRERAEIPLAPAIPVTGKQTTDEKGCVELPYQFSFDPYGRPEWKTFEVEVAGQERPYRNTSARATFSVQPIAGFGPRFWDLGVGPAPALPENAPAARLSLGRVQYRQDRLQILDMTPDFELYLSRNYVVTLSPEVGRPRYGSEGLQDGLYRVRGLIFFPDTMESQTNLSNPLANGECYYRAGSGLNCPFEKEVLAENGRIQFEAGIVFEVHQLYHMQSRGELYLEVSSLFPGTELLPVNVKAIFTARTGDRESAPLTQTIAALSWPELVTGPYSYEGRIHHDFESPTWNQYGTLRFDPSRSRIFETEYDLDMFIEHWFDFYQGEADIKFGDIYNRRKIAEYWTPRVRAGSLRDESALFCGAFYEPETSGFFQAETAYEACQDRAESRLAFIPFKQFEALESVNDTRIPMPDKLKVETSFFKEDNDSVSKGAGIKSFAKAAISFYEVGATGVEGYISHSVEDKVSSRTRNRITQTREILHETFRVDYSARARKCLWITPRPIELPIQKGVQVCQSRAEVEDFEESWHFLGWKAFDVNANSSDPEMSDWVKVVRSDFAFRRLTRAFENEIGLLIDRIDNAHLDEAFGADATRAYLRRMTLLDRDFGDSAFMRMEEGFAFGERLPDTLMSYFLDGSIPGIIDERDRFHGLDLIEYYFDSDVSDSDSAR